MELNDEVSTESGSDRFVVLANSTVAWIETQSPGTDCVIVVDLVPRVVC